MDIKAIVHRTSWFEKDWLLESFVNDIPNVTLDGLLQHLILL